MRFKTPLVAIAAFSLISIAGCYSSSDNASDQGNAQNNSAEPVRPGHYETVQGTKDAGTDYQPSKTDNTRTVTHPESNVKQEIWDPSGPNYHNNSSNSNSSSGK